MPTVSGGDLTLLRAEQHSTELFLSFLVPRTLWTARVNNASIARGATSIAFDGGAGTMFANIEAGQTVWVGSGAGENDIGRARVRSITSGDSGVTGTLTVAANSFVWTDNAYLTFYHIYELWPKYPFIESNGDFKKDKNIAYSDENLKPPPVVIAGDHRAGFINTTLGYFEINVNLASSYVVASGATISSYAMSVVPSAGHTTNFSTVTGQGFLRFSTAGQRWVKFSVTDSNGKTQDTYRSYWAHSPVRTNADYPFVDFELGSISGDWNRGGYTAGIKVHDNASLTEIPERTLCVLWQRAKYGATEKNITFLPDRSSSILVGYVRKENITHNIQGGEGDIDFEITTIDDLDRNHYMFSVSLEVISGTPSKWYEFSSWLTPGRAVHHFLKWHSTMLEVCDVIGLTADTTPIAYAEIEDGTLYSMPDSFLRNRSIRNHLVCDKGGRIRMVKDIQLLSDSDRAGLTIVQSITKPDRSGIITIIHDPNKRAPFVHTSGFSFAGTFTEGKPDVNAICAIAPGQDIEDDGPSPVSFDRQTFTNQTHANQIAGRVLATTNNPYPEVRINFHGNYFGVLDPAYGEFWTLSLLSGDTIRGLVWVEQKLILRQVTANIQGGGALTCSAIFEPEAEGPIGQSTDCPEFPDIGGDDLEIPAESDLSGALVTAGSVYYLNPFGDWVLRSSDATQDIEPDPYWPVTQASSASIDAILLRCGVGYIKRSTDGGQNWSTLTVPNPPNDAGDSPAPTSATVTNIRIEGSYAASQEFVMLRRWQNAGDEWRSWIAYTDDNGANWTQVQMG